MSRRRRELIEAKRALCWGGPLVTCLAHDRCPQADECEQAGACIAEASAIQYSEKNHDGDICKTALEMRLFDALKRITRYETAERLLKRGERDYGISGGEVLEMAYENIQAEAKRALKGVRLPKPEHAPAPATIEREAQDAE